MESMTPRERWLAVLGRQQPDRVPTDYWATPEATQRLIEFLRVPDEAALGERLHLDWPTRVAPAYVGPALKPGFDFYGCGYAWVDYGSGRYEECVFHPLAGYDTIEAIEANYRWPTADWFDYSVLPDQVRGREQYPVRGGGSEPFLTYTYLRGLEQAYMDLMLNPDLVAYCLDRLFDFSYEDTRRIFEQLPGRVDFTYVAEDFGAQDRLLFPPETIRTIFIPRMKRMIDLSHEAGAYVFCHSDGAIRPIIPDLIEAGIDLLNPIQWRCAGMERAALKRDFGDHVIFNGGMDNQHTLVFGTVEEVRQEVLDNLQILGAGGGYILGPCHNIQAVSPPENIVAMYDATFLYGRDL